MLDQTDFDVDWETAKLPVARPRGVEQDELPGNQPRSRVEDETAPASQRGRRAEQAARERSMALKALAVVSVLGVLAWALFAGIGPIKPLFGNPASTAAQSSAAGASAKTKATNKSAKRKTSGKRTAASSNAGSSAGGVSSASQTGSAAKKTPIALASTTAAGRISAAASTKPAVASKKTPSKSKPKARAPTAASKGTVTVETFGYSFAGPPSGSKLVADVRNIQAGDFKQSETGLMESVRARVMAVQAAKTWLNTMETQWTPQLKSGDKVAIGCARGHHRSVTLAYLYTQYLRQHGWTVNLVHRDISKTW